jgi:hypothetical protein
VPRSKKKHAEIMVAEFELRWEHLELMKHLQWTMLDSESHYPAADPKRPYGNSDYIGDMRRILENAMPDDDGPGVVCPKCSHEFIPPMHSRQELESIQDGMATALEIVCQIQQFSPGIFQKISRQGSVWHEWRRNP